MPFDLESLMNNPMFVGGLGLLGSAAPRNKGLLGAYQMLNEQQQQKQKYGLELAAAQRAEEQGKLYAQQVAVSMQNMQRQAKIADQLGPLIGAAMQSVTPQQQGQPAQPAAPIVPEAPATPAPSGFANADRFVSRIEGGYVPNDGGKGPTNYGINQNANPDINVRSLTPDAAAQIRQQRYWSAIKGDSLPPSTAAVAYDAAINQGQGYAQNLLEKTGGDPALMLYQRQQDYRALAKTNPLYAKNLPVWEDRLAQLRKELQTQPSQPAQTQQPAAPAQPQVQSPGSFSLPADPARAFGIAAGGIRAASGDFGGLSDMVKALENKAYKPGDIVAGPGGRTTILPDVLGERRVAAEETNARVNAAKAAAEIPRIQSETKASEQKQTSQKATDFGQVQGMLDTGAQLNKAATSLINNPALARITGFNSKFPNYPGSPAANAQADLDALGSQILLSRITALKALSQNGSTGFGQLSNVEGSHLINSLASLKESQSPQQMRDRLVVVNKANNALTNRTIEVYERTHNDSPFQGLPVGTRPYVDDRTGAQQTAKDGSPLLKLPDGRIVKVTQ